ncbi:MAG: DUF58 domain-containing protein [Longimicrobiales bacterium]|nr:DUF58 domain-containing protein [Longimicrobiales bacterium]
MPLTHSRRPDLLDPPTLARLGGLELLARQVVEGFLMGLHRSPHRGFSAEFAELRNYQPGDDLRYIDWRMYARSDRFFVKQFEEETNLRAHLLLDISASMAWSSRPDELPPKLWYAKLVAAALSLVLIRQGDTVGLTTFHDEIVTRLQARGGPRQWAEIVHRLDAAEPGGRTRPQAGLRDIATRLRRRGLVVLLSDLLVDREETLTALRFLRHRGHEVLVLHVIDPGERELPPAADVRFFDPESDEELRINAADVREDYRAAVTEAIDEWRRSLVPDGIDYHVLDTDRPLALALRAYLRKRERLG